MRTPVSPSSPAFVAFRVAAFRVAVLTALAVFAPPTAAQTPPGPSAAAAEVAAAEAAAQQTAVGPAATLVYANRPIVQLRASVLGRLPAERAAAGQMTLRRLVDAGATGQVRARTVGPAISLEVDGTRVVALFPADVDALAGESLASVADGATARLRLALREAAELRQPRQWLVGGGLVLFATVLFGLLTWGLLKARRRIGRRIREATARRLRATAAGDPDTTRFAHLFALIDRSLGVVAFVLVLFLAYWWTTFSLRRFPYTRPWGEALRGFLLGQVSGAGTAMLAALPELFTVLLIIGVTRVVVRIVQLLFQSMEDGRLELPLMYPETVQPTRKLLTLGLWLFAATIAYPYLPGSGSDAFKGMSVFVGLVVSLGSSGIVNQVMSGFTLIYSRALRKGDFVATGGVEGVVTQVGTLSTKIKTPKGEDVTIPNSLIVSQTVTNYSRFADTEGVYLATDITIGYDVPWRQVQSLLLMAVARTPGIRQQPVPLVHQTALEDAYVRYTLLFSPENQERRRPTLAAVHASILDAFNEYGVQIMSPVYEADPGAPKIVPRDQWFSAPAAPATPAAGTTPPAVES
jgi:small-conductance mechanosensitive channel